MSRKGYSTIHVDWINVTYKSVYTTLGLVLLAIGGVAGYWYYNSVHLPKASAAQAIEQAGAAFREAAVFRDVDSLGETVYRAEEALEESRRSFDRSQYDDAQFAALHSMDLSRKAVKMAGGDAGDVSDARFYKLEGDVRVKKAGEFSWEPADARMTLHIGDQVKTSSSASAQVIYFDGTVTTIEPGSLLEIRELFQDPVTKVQRVREKLTFGEVNASIRNGRVDGSYHEVATEKVSARAEEESEMRVAYDSEKKTSRFDVFSGKVVVESGGRKESLEAGDRIRAAADGRLGARETLPGVPRLRSPADQRVFVFADPGAAQVTLSWEQIQQIPDYHLMIAGKPLFTDPLFSGNRKGGSASLEGLEEGSYYWKVAAVRDGATGPYSEVRTFRISSQKIKDREDSEPPALEVSDFVSIGGMVIINGRSEPGAVLWIDNEKVDVYDDGSFNAVIRLQQEGLNEIVFVAQDNAGNETRKIKTAYVDQF